jgi:seryl-tRNA synthetase
MIDIRDLRDNPDKYRTGAANKNMDPAAVDALLEADKQLRALTSQQQELTAEKNRIGKEIGKIAGQMKKADADTKAQLQQQMADLQQRPNAIKQEEAELAEQIRPLEARRDELLLDLPQPADPDVPVGKSADDNVELSQWCPDGFDVAQSFEANKGFAAKSHIDLMTALNLVDFARGPKISGARSYVLVGDGFRLHQAILRYAFDFMVNQNGFTPLSAASLVRDEMMVGTGFFPHGRDQVYDIANPTGEGYGQAMVGTGEVALMGYHADEIIDADTLPRCYTTLSPCFRREAGAAGKDTAGLYRIHQFEKVEQVVICKADEAESRAWHKKMIGFVESLLQSLDLPYRLLQCCTGDLGPKNADMIDIECWMPSRGADGTGDWGETHSASRLYDYQCRRLNIRYKDPETGKNTICHSLNNTVAASPRILIPLVEMYQNADGSITIPQQLRPYMNGQDTIGG